MALHAASVVAISLQLHMYLVVCTQSHEPSGQPLEHPAGQEKLLLKAASALAADIQNLHSV